MYIFSLILIFFLLLLITCIIIEIPFVIFIPFIYLGLLINNIYYWLILGVLIVLFGIPIIRQNIFIRFLLFVTKKLGFVKSLSPTEEIALKTGTAWIEKDFFKGKFNVRNFSKEKYDNELSKKEQEFFNTKVNELCQIIDEWEIQQGRDIGEKTWKFLKENKFFSLIIPEEYDGLEFSALANSSIVAKIASHSQALAITVMVPNSLGPGELLIKYGTKKQKNYYLPRLANGQDIPCFALTESNAGSDATSLDAQGVVFRDIQGNIKIRLNWEKRYITLGGVATVIGLAFNLYDPEQFLGKETKLGITCALISNSLDGVIQGKRHDPLGVPFVNSPIKGENVVIGIEDIISEKNGLGKGWEMLMNCLAVGRGISLPAISGGGLKLLSQYTNHYVKVRKQFGQPLINFEGIQESLMDIVAENYMVDAMRVWTANAIDGGQRPPVINAIIKYHTTEKLRTALNHSMDILAGKSIIRGPKNIINTIYNGTPIAITVEGANILTRSLMQFGQGIMCCHPYLYEELQAINNKKIKPLDQLLNKHFKFVIKNLTSTFLLFISRGLFVKTYSPKILKKYERRLAIASSIFASYSDIMIALYSSKIKQKEYLNSRMGDMLSALYIASATMRRYEAEHYPKQEEELIKYILNKQLTNFDQALQDLLANIGYNFFSSTKSKTVAFFLFTFPLNTIYNFVVNNFNKFTAFMFRIFPMCFPKLAHDNIVAYLNDFNNDLVRVQKHSQGLYFDENNTKSELVLAYFAHKQSLLVEPILKNIKKDCKKRKLSLETSRNYNKLVELNVISKSEYEEILKFNKLQKEVISVDSFNNEEYLNVK